MYVFKYSKDLLNFLSSNADKDKSIGFVPTMGALHGGHMALIQEAKKKDDIVICCIFVNPTQFNDKNDFDLYPSTIEEDILQLEKNQTDILFLPSEKEVYPSGVKISTTYNFGNIDKVLEGLYRPDHFNGVAQVVSRLLELVKPHNLYMGQKDYQQVLIVKKMLEQFDKKVNLIMCSTVREKSGLAMSSRNTRLSDNARLNAAAIYEILSIAKDMIAQKSIVETKRWAMQKLEKDIPHSKLEYLEFVDAESLITVEKKKKKCEIIICVAIFIDDVRLIDNVIVQL